MFPNQFYPGLVLSLQSNTAAPTAPHTRRSACNHCFVEKLLTLIKKQTMPQYRNYRILLTKEPEGGYTVNVPTFPGCITFGETIDEAILMAKDAIELYIESLLEHGEPVPTEDNTFEYSVSVMA